MRYAIKSESERGWWSNTDGWVFSIWDATIFDSKLFGRPSALNHDAEWVCVDFTD